MAIAETAVVTPRGFQLRVVPANQAAFTLSRDVAGVGAAGDRVQRLLLNVTTPSAASVTLVDNYTDYPILVAGPNVLPGPMIVELGVYSKTGAWVIRTGAGVSTTVVGEFSP